MTGGGYLVQPGTHRMVCIFNSYSVQRPHFDMETIIILFLYRV